MTARTSSAVRRSRILCVLAVALPAMTPAPAASQTSLGIKAGVSFGTLSNKAPDWQHRTGFAAGIAFDLRAGLIGIQPEALYVQKGVNFDGTPSGSSTAPKLSYLEIPVLLKVTVPTPGVQPMFYAGPSVMFRLACSYQGADCSAVTRKTDYGAVLGAGLRFGGDRGVTIEGRYTWGLKDINDPGEGVKRQTRTFLILAGVSL